MGATAKVLPARRLRKMKILFTMKQDRMILKKQAGKAHSRSSAVRSSREQEDTHLRLDEGGPCWSGWRVQSLSVRLLGSTISFHVHHGMTGRNGCCVTQSGRSARSLPGAKNSRFSPSLFFPIHTLKSPVGKSAGPRGWCPLKEMGHRWILELSFLPLPGPLNKTNEEMVCNCLVNSQLHPHLSMNYQTCLSVTLTCDFNITTGITLTVLTQAKI